MRTEAGKTDRRRRLIVAASALLFCANCVVSPVVPFLRGKRPKTWTAAVVMLFFGTSILWCDGLILSESGTAHPILARGPACYLWLAAFAVLTAGMALDGLLCRKYE